MKHFKLWDKNTKYFPWWMYFLLLAVLYVVAIWFPWSIMIHPPTGIEYYYDWANEAFDYTVAIGFIAVLMYIGEKL